jgi:hypothetical protein
MRASRPPPWHRGEPLVEAQAALPAGIRSRARLRLELELCRHGLPQASWSWSKALVFELTIGPGERLSSASNMENPGGLGSRDESVAGLPHLI